MHLQKARKMNFDEILCLIGGFGKFQKILYVWICIPQIFLAFHMLVSIFTGAVPPHFCRSTWPSAAVPTSVTFNLSHVYTTDGPADLSCMVPLNHSGVPSHGHTSGSCHGGWEYSKETFQSTIVTEVGEKLSLRLTLISALKFNDNKYFNLIYST